MNVLNKNRWLLPFLGGAVLLSLFVPRLQAAKPEVAPGRKAAVTITVAQAQRADFPVRLNASGTVASIESVDLRAQTSSTVRKVHVKEGDFVQAGQLLFTLDARADQARLAQAQGQRARDLAQLNDAQRQLARARDLVAQGFMSQSAVDTAAAQVQTLQAAVQADDAAVQAARVQLGFNQLRAPFGGRIGAINSQVGALVQANSSALPMLTLTRMDPVSVSFSVPEAQLQGLLVQQAKGALPVKAQAAGAASAVQGQLAFIDNAVDSSVGGVRAKARFDNQSLQLWPGQSARVELTVQVLPQAVQLPLQALIDGPKGLLVYVVQDDGTVQPRPVKLRAQDEKLAAVEGLQGGERVVLEGKQNLKPGSAVKIEGEGKGDKKVAAAASAPKR